MQSLTSLVDKDKDKDKDTLYFTSVERNSYYICL